MSLTMRLTSRIAFRRSFGERCVRRVAWGCLVARFFRFAHCAEMHRRARRTPSPLPIQLGLARVGSFKMAEVGQIRLRLWERSTASLFAKRSGEGDLPRSRLVGA